MEFRATIGHRKQKDFFLSAIRSRSLAHAYVFSGPEHTGKTTFALELSSLVGADRVLDLSVFDNENGLAIGEAREIQSRLSLTPIGTNKIAIITHAERMTAEAANSLLKTLEEPPRHSILILVTANFHALPPTIVSRSQRVSFGLLTPEELKEHLGESGEMDVDEVSELALGRFGLAQKILKDSDYREFLSDAKNSFEILKNGSLLQRLQAAENLAQRDSVYLENFLRVLMLWWCQTPLEDLGGKLLAALRGMQYNLNTKLVLTNLFVQ